MDQTWLGSWLQRAPCKPLDFPVRLNSVPREEVTYEADRHTEIQHRRRSNGNSFNTHGNFRVILGRGNNYWIFPKVFSPVLPFYLMKTSHKEEEAFIIHKTTAPHRILWIKTIKLRPKTCQKNLRTTARVDPAANPRRQTTIYRRVVTCSAYVDGATLRRNVVVEWTLSSVLQC